MSSFIILHKTICMHKYEGVPQGVGREGGREGIPYIKGNKKNCRAQQI